MKKIIRLLCLVLVFVMCFTTLACTPDNGEDEYLEPIDETRTQLFVNNYYGGFGSEWLVEAKRKYEALHVNDEWEEGKKGVQIYINPEKSNMQEKASSVLTGRDEVYFTEWAYYYSLKSEGLLGDITDAVTKPNSYDVLDEKTQQNKTIESKLTSEQKQYYGIQEGQEVKYYGLPHYSSYSGIIYNVDLFDKELYYFADEPAGTKLEDFFIWDKTETKSAGPNGEYGDYDDGLPSTYEEFFMLCEYICQSGNTPITWSGAYSAYYLQWFAQALCADYEGADKMRISYTLDGTMDDLGKVVGGAFVEDATDTTITNANGYELYRSAGRYYALQFLAKLINTAKYRGELSMNSGYSHTDAQDDFLWAGYDGGATKPIAMLIEGNWWENEASSTFNTMASTVSSDLARDKRNFAWLPLPKATEENLAQSRTADKASTVVDFIYSMCFMKANIASWKKDLAIDFIQFVNTDEQLREFTKFTNTTKALNYTMNDNDLNGMSTFGKSNYYLKERSEILYPYSTNSLYLNNQAYFGAYGSFYTDLGSDGTFQWLSSTIYSGVKPNDYFTGMAKYYKNNWIM